MAEMTRLLLDATAPPPYRRPSLDDDQQRVVAHQRGALRVLAGPGTGKTTTLVAAMASRLMGEDPLPASQVLGLTFGRRAALHWRDQVTRATGGGQVPLVSTFHSFCYGLLRRFASEDDYQSALRLLSGPEQQVRAKLLFEEAVAAGRVSWPAELAEAVGTRGMVEEIRAVMARTRSHAMDPSDLSLLAQEEGNSLWRSVAQFMDEYLTVMDFAGVLDYSELIYRALILAQEPEVQRYLHSTFRAIYVDEYQDTDPGQILLLKAMVTAESSLVVVGDFDQAIYGFRGADEAAIQNFREDFQSIFGDQIDDVVLGTCRRFGSSIRRAAELVISPYQPSRAQIGHDVVQRHRHLNCERDEAGAIELLTFDTDGSQAAHIADRLAREHAVNGRAWSDMAVIVRSAVTSLPAIYRAFIAADIPVEVASDEIPIHLDPAVAPLLDLLRAVDDERTLTAQVAHDLLTGPLAGLDPVDLRRFGRYLRDQDRVDHPERVPESSGRLVADALRRGEVRQVPPQHRAVATSVLEVGKSIRAAREGMRSGDTPHEVLFRLWSATKWGEQLRIRALSGGATASRAHRDLDAICALFTHAARFASRGRTKDLTVFLDELLAQQIPAETLAENDLRGDAVRLLTAHRAKGLEWPFVVVAAVQEGLWPNTTVPATLLQPERIGPHRVVPPQVPREVLDAERRLFYVAMTRARDNLVITAVDATQRDDGARPSHFFDQLEAAADTLGVAEVRYTVGRPVTPLTADGVVARLRRVLADPGSSAALRHAAAARLASLLTSGGPVFTHANPERWWGMADRTELAPVVDSLVPLSGSGISSIEKCPARWFLERQVRAQIPSELHMVFGSALHKVAEGLSNGTLMAELAAIDATLDRLWPGMGYDVAWESRRQRADARAASIRLLRWFLDHAAAQSVVESQLTLQVSVPHPTQAEQFIAVALNGRADRIEFTADGAAVYDFKTGRKAATPGELAANIQLALYEIMLRHGEFEVDGEKRKLPDDMAVTHTALVQLRVSDKSDDSAPRVQEVPFGTHDSKNPDRTVVQRIAAAADLVQAEVFPTRYVAEECKRCPVRFLCPASPEGRQVL
jgi:superfamily I DNA/RNA helicase/RecB family exonuclease